MSRLCLYYRGLPESDRWIRGDRHFRPLVRRLVRGKPRLGGVDKVFINLCRGLDLLNVRYEVNLPFTRLTDGDRVGVLGRGRQVLDGYDRGNPIVAGIALMSHPSEWPSLFEDYPVKVYLQHSEWVAEIYRRTYGASRCGIWPVGIDTDSWLPHGAKDVDLLIYDKRLWEHEPGDREVLFQRVIAEIDRRGLTSIVMRYGAYQELEYRHALGRARGMVFLCEHESQGIAYQECLASDVPVLAWDQGMWLDPNRGRWGESVVAASSVPYFDERCGERFVSASTLGDKLDLFVDGIKSGHYRPREYILENLTLEHSARRYLEFFD